MKKIPILLSPQPYQPVTTHKSSGRCGPCDSLPFHKRVCVDKYSFSFLRQGRLQPRRASPLAVLPLPPESWDYRPAPPQAATAAKSLSEYFVWVTNFWEITKVNHLLTLLHPFSGWLGLLNASQSVLSTLNLVREANKSHLRSKNVSKSCCGTRMWS